MKELVNELIIRTKRNLSILILLFLMWLILFEKITLFSVASGILISALVVFVTDHFLLQENYEHAYIIKLYILVQLFLILLFDIFKAGITIIPKILSGKADVQIVNYVTPLKDELLIDLLANSITLPPGSVTIEKKGNQIKILTLVPPKKDIKEIIPVKIENLLLNYEKSQNN